jgi:hypothetical protein
LAYYICEQDNEISELNKYLVKWKQSQKRKAA